MAVRVDEERGPRQVQVELEVIEIDAGNARQADADELLGDVLNLVQTNNLLVEAEAVPSGLATEDDEQRLAAAPRFRPGGFP